MRLLTHMAGLCAAALMLPLLAHAQDGVSGQMQSLHEVLAQLYEEMIPLCTQLISVARAIAGFAALWYIGFRVWGSLARAEPIDVFPLLRPFALGLCILMFPAVLGVINGLMSPVVRGTASMVQGSDQAVDALLKHKEEALEETDSWQMYVGMSGEGDEDRWYRYTHPDDPDGGGGMLSGIGDDIRFAMAKASYGFRNSVKAWMSEVLEVLFQAAALCIDTIRTFSLIVLAVTGPLAFGLSVFDGFRGTVSHWLARYIQVSLWLPVANIFGAMIGQIQENMLRIDLGQIAQTGNTFFSPTDVAYLVFLVIAIIGYLSVPFVAGQVVSMGGHSGSPVAAALAGSAVTAVVRGPASGSAAAGSSPPGYDPGSRPPFT